MNIPQKRIRREIFGPPKDITAEPGWPKSLSKDATVTVALKGGPHPDRPGGRTTYNITGTRRDCCTQCVPFRRVQPLPDKASFRRSVSAGRREGKKIGQALRLYSCLHGLSVDGPGDHDLDRLTLKIERKVLWIYRCFRVKEKSPLSPGEAAGSARAGSPCAG